MKDEALKLALEAGNDDLFDAMQVAFLEHLVALVRADERDRAAQPVQEPFCFFYVENGEEYFAPKGAYVPDNAQPLYTTPPAAQRQWVGLAEADKDKPDLGAYVYLNDDWLDGYKTGMEYAEAKLKEKNNG